MTSPAMMGARPHTSLEGADEDIGNKVIQVNLPSTAALNMSIKKEAVGDQHESQPTGGVIVAAKTPEQQHYRSNGSNKPSPAPTVTPESKLVPMSESDDAAAKPIDKEDTTQDASTTAASALTDSPPRGLERAQEVAVSSDLEDFSSQQRRYRSFSEDALPVQDDEDGSNDEQHQKSNEYEDDDDDSSDDESSYFNDPKMFPEPRSDRRYSVNSSSGQNSRGSHSHRRQGSNASLSLSSDDEEDHRHHHHHQSGKHPLKGTSSAAAVATAPPLDVPPAQFVADLHTDNIVPKKHSISSLISTSSHNSSDDEVSNELQQMNSKTRGRRGKRQSENKDGDVEIVPSGRQSPVMMPTDSPVAANTTDTANNTPLYFSMPPSSSLHNLQPSPPTIVANMARQQQAAAAAAAAAQATSSSSYPTQQQQQQFQHPQVLSAQEWAASMAGHSNAFYPLPLQQQSYPMTVPPLLSRSSMGSMAYSTDGSQHELSKAGKIPGSNSNAAGNNFGRGDGGNGGGSGRGSSRHSGSNNNFHDRSLSSGPDGKHNGGSGGAPYLSAQSSKSVQRGNMKSGYDDDDNDVHQGFKVYWQRWIMLFYMSTLNLLSDWTCYSVAPIALLTEQAFGNINPEQLVTIFLGANAVSSACEPILLSRLGLRKTVLLGSLLMMIGSIIKSGGMPPIIQADIKKGEGEWRVYLGFFLVGLSQPLYQCTPALLSASWFPERERTMATGVALNSNQLGIGFAFVFGTLLVSSSDDIPGYFGLLSIIATITFMGTLIQFDDAPPTPPSDTAKVMRGTVNFPDSFRSVLDSVRTFGNSNPGLEVDIMETVPEPEADTPASDASRKRTAKSSPSTTKRKSSSGKQKKKSGHSSKLSGGSDSSSTRRRNTSGGQQDPSSGFHGFAPSPSAANYYDTVAQSSDGASSTFIANAPSAALPGPVGPAATPPGRPDDESDGQDGDEARTGNQSAMPYGQLHPGQQPWMNHPGMPYGMPMMGFGAMHPGEDDQQHAAQHYGYGYPPGGYAPQGYPPYGFNPYVHQYPHGFYPSHPQQFHHSEGQHGHHHHSYHSNYQHQVPPYNPYATSDAYEYIESHMLPQASFIDEGAEPVLTLREHHLDINIRDDQIILSTRACLARPGFIHSLVAFTVSAIVVNTLSTFMDYLVRLNGAGREMTGIVGGAFQGCIMISSLIVGSLTDRTRAYYSVTIGMLVLGAFGLAECGVSLNADRGSDLRWSLVLVAILVGPLQPVSTELGVDVVYPLSENTVLVIQQLFANLLSAAFIPCFKAMKDIGVDDHGDPNEEHPQYTFSFYLLIVLHAAATVFFATFNGRYLRYEHEQEKKKDEERRKQAAESAAFEPVYGSMSQPAGYSNRSSSDYANEQRPLMRYAV